MFTRHLKFNMLSVNFGALILPNLKTYYRAPVIKTVWCGQNNRQIAELNKMENPEIDSHRQLIFDKGAKTVIQWSKIVFSIVGAVISRHPRAKINFDTDLRTFTKINVK